MDQNIPSEPTQSEPVQQPEPFPQEPRKESDKSDPTGQPKKFPKYLITILAIAGILVAGYFVFAKYQEWWPFPQVIEDFKQPSGATNLKPPIVITDETANWKTYRNEEYGFEFKYPGEWGIPGTRADYNNNSFYIYLKCPEVALGGEGQCPLQIIAMPATSPEKFLSERFLPESGMSEKRGEISYKQINSITTVSFNHLYETTGYVENYPEIVAIYLTFLGNDSYITFADYTPSSYPKNEVYDQIISTFKFTNANWKTTTNASLGYSIKYPNGWKAETNSLSTTLTNLSNSEQVIMVELNSTNANPNQLSINEWLQTQQWPDPKPISEQFKSIAAIGGVSAVEQSQNGTIYFAKGANVFVVSNGIGFERKVVNETLLLQILSTFKFTK